ncbi:hypothetical protein EIP86_004745 [Pleurotus ostreatoroseus]|nr:hypothetical protein EIP86_004745 [Pleurotus ostreatoroseus]
MPVPVPVYSKPPAHPVIKTHRSQAVDTDYVRHSVFKHLTHSLPRPPAGPPPSLATREEWISSLPSWRRNKPRRIWEDDSLSYTHPTRQGFRQGLAVAGNAAVIKGGPAQASIPPISTLIAGADMARASLYGTAEDEDDLSPMDGVVGWQGEDVAQLIDEDEDMAAEHASDSGSLDYAYSGKSCAYQADHRDEQRVDCQYERGAFSPFLDEPSPENDRNSSPVGPATPFADYVDRAVTESDHLQKESVTAAAVQYCNDEYCGAQCYECQRYQQSAAQVVQQPIAPEPIVTPSASTAYKRLAEPLSQWVANFVWKVCTTGMSLPSAYAQPSAFVKHYASNPPEHLARATHSMLLSTLLQPSAIYLALWYIVRLPVFFGPVGLGPEHVKEMRFRAELLGDAHMAYEREKYESSAPFRLVLLGCMLANKWLDDHTFSNKTWHTISSVPVRTLNVLESLALDLFKHDLSIPASEWADWLKQLHAYHLSLTSPSFPQPISRPSSSPHTMIRKALESLMEATDACKDNRVNGTLQPIFFGLDDKKKELAEREQTYEDVDVLEFDLDEDGPLREEYLPRRRISSATRPSQTQERSTDRLLPPPAKWSPAADEPLIPSAGRRQYVAPQPIARHAHGSAPAPIAPPPAPFQQALDMTRRIWPADEQVSRYTAVHSLNPYGPLPAYGGFEYTYPPPAPPPLTVPGAHSRSHSLSFNPSAVGQSQGHYRSYSQTRFDGGYNDVRYVDPHHAPHAPVPHWTARFDCAMYPPAYEPAYDYHHRTLVKV